MDRTHALPITRQAQLLGISRSNMYYKPVTASAEDLRQMRRIDELHLEFPFCGSRMLRDLLVQEGFRVGRKHVATLMRRMGIEAIYRRRTPLAPVRGSDKWISLRVRLPPRVAVNRSTRHLGFGGQGRYAVVGY